MSLTAAAAALATELAGALRSAIELRGCGVLAVSGGRTPGHVFQQLKREELDWSRVTLTLTDDRWVPPDHPESNERLVRSQLFSGPPEAASFVSLYGCEDSPHAGWPACRKRLTALPLPFDAVYLGIGEDGHVASLFPDDPSLEIRDDLCVPVRGTGARLPRMSLTMPMLLTARKLYVLFSGRRKEAFYADAKMAGSERDIPLRAVLSQTTVPVCVMSAP